MIKEVKKSAQWIRDALDVPFSNIEARQNDLLAMEHLQPLYKTYLPWTSSALRPSAVAVILNDIIIHQRRNIVELGAGVSTFFIARILADYPGHLFSVEHDAEWLSIVSAELEKEGLQDKVTLIHAPLVETRYSSEQANLQNELFDYKWYNLSILDKELPESDIDLVVVDGPPAYRKEERHARYPALPYLASRLSENHTFILDDANRVGEQKVIKQWQQHRKAQFSILKTRGNIAISQSGLLYTI